MIQRRQGVRVHPPGRQIEGHFRTHHRGRGRGSWHPRRGSEGALRPLRQSRKSLGDESFRRRL